MSIIHLLPALLPALVTISLVTVFTIESRSYKRRYDRASLGDSEREDYGLKRDLLQDIGTGVAIVGGLVSAVFFFAF